MEQIARHISHISTRVSFMDTAIRRQDARFCQSAYDDDDNDRTTGCFFPNIAVYRHLLLNETQSAINLQSFTARLTFSRCFTANASGVYGYDDRTDIRSIYCLARTSHLLECLISR